MARVVLNRPEVTATAHRYATPLVRRTVQQIHVGARRLAPRGDHMKGSGKRQPGQPLQSSVETSFRSTTNRVSGFVGSRKEYAVTVHDGSKPHVIRAKGKLLKFRSDRLDFLVAARAGRRGGNKRRGGFFYAVRVRHPGNRRPVRYLVTPLFLFGRANGFVVTRFTAPISRLP